MQSARAGNPAPSGDPFEALLESAAATRRAEPEARGRQNARQEPAAPRSRAETRNEALTRKDVSGAPVRPEPTDAQPAKAGDGAVSDNGAATASEGETQTATASDSGPVAEESTAGEDGETIEAGAATAETNADGEAEASVAAVAQGETQEQEAATIDGGSEATDLVPAATAPVEAVAEAETEVDLLPTAAAGVPADATAQPIQASIEPSVQTVPAAAAQTPETAADDAPELANTPVVTANNAAPMPTAAPSASTSATGHTEAPDALPVQPAPQRAAAPSPEQPQTQTAAQSSFAAALAGEGATPSSDHQGNEQLQQRPNAPQPAPKPNLDVKPEQFADAAKPAAPAPEAASLKAEPDALPEPLRALAQTLNTPSANGIHFRAATLNERAPIPLAPTALAAEIVSRVRDGMQRFEIRLDPPELGRVDVRLEVDRAGNVKTRLTVDRPETLDLMQRDARGLERALQQAGLKTDSGGLEFSLRSHAEGHAHEGHADRHGRGRNLTPDEGGERIEAVIDGYRSSALARGGVDIRI